MKYRILVFLFFFFQVSYFCQDRWDVIGEMPVPVHGGEAVALDTSILIIGGYSDSLQADVKIIQSYNPYLNRWSIVGSLPQGRSGLYAGLYNGNILIFGGISEPDSISKNLLYYDTASMTSVFITDSNLNINRIYPTGIIRDNYLYIIGGYPIFTGTENIDTSYIIQYDLNSRKIDNKGIAQYSNSFGLFPSEQMALLYNDRIYIFGGSYNGVSKRIYTYNFSTDSINRSEQELPIPRAGGKAIFYNSTAFLIGGYNETDGALASVENIEFNGDNIYYSDMPQMNYGRKNLMAALFNDFIYVFGGTDSLNKIVRQVERIYAYTSATAVTNKSLADNFYLDQNYPNPFNSSTKIKFSNKTAVLTSLKIYNALGETVRTLFNNEVISGPKISSWDGKDDNGNPVPTGIYIYQLSSGNNLISKKMVLLK